jgi:hypothetical protein
MGHILSRIRPSDNPVTVHEAGGETRVHGTEIANSVPDFGWRGADRHFFVYRIHAISFLQHDPVLHR